MNWCERLARQWRFVGDTLDDREVFDEAERDRVRAAVDEVVGSWRTAADSEYELLMERAVDWCRAHPEPIPFPGELDVDWDA